MPGVDGGGGTGGLRVGDAAGASTDKEWMRGGDGGRLAGADFARVSQLRMARLAGELEGETPATRAIVLRFLVSIPSGGAFLTARCTGELVGETPATRASILRLRDPGESSPDSTAPPFPTSTSSLM